MWSGLRERYSCCPDTSGRGSSIHHMIWITLTIISQQVLQRKLMVILTYRRTIVSSWKYSTDVVKSNLLLSAWQHFGTCVCRPHWSRIAYHRPIYRVIRASLSPPQMLPASAFRTFFIFLNLLRIAVACAHDLNMLSNVILRISG